ncbi:MAG: hypothetical protein ACNA7Y_01035 [Gammaproteobacteria bacterium]
MQVLPTTQLHLPELTHVAAMLKSRGRLEESFGGLAYLNVDDAYIHQLFPLLHVPGVQKPNYFGRGSIGAHISVTYPEEGIIIHQKDRGQEYDFNLTGVFTSELKNRRYYILHVESPALLALRERYGLSKNPQFAGYWVNLHITIGIFPL